jgi:two-component system NtrC family sensor kinase
MLMHINLKTKIWLTICSIVLMFSFFTLYYFPRQQGNLLIDNYNTEVQNLANTVALGVKIAITEQNFEGVQTAIEFVKGDPRLQFVSMLQYDTTWDVNHNNFQIKKTVFKTFPENEHPDPEIVTTNTLIVKRATFNTSVMSGAILLGFNTNEIIKSKQKITLASLFVSSTVFFIGILIGLWLARNISLPVLALRDAANRVGEGDLNQKVIHIHHDEIGELGQAFNKMVDDLAKTGKELNEKNEVLSSTNATLNNTLLQLKDTHAQLIQSEKMASLGELTAGIAHEIQNPLNFVNNFSEINIELIEELKEELDKNNFTEVRVLANDIKENEKKINHHGKRADSIIKGMLQHSRSSSGVKEPTDINAIADEYFRLAYHGLRAKDKTFNAAMKTSYDESIGKIDVVPQDIGRVILNLITNAFYAVTEKKKQIGNGFEPLVFVRTQKTDNKIFIAVKDNGNGVPQKILDKIFQPFFTTKPTGQGTGLGLSMSYDIVTKVHGGEIKVVTTAGEGSEFIIILPV